MVNQLDKSARNKEKNFTSASSSISTTGRPNCFYLSRRKNLYQNQEVCFTHPKFPEAGVSQVTTGTTCQDKDYVIQGKVTHGIFCLAFDSDLESSSEDHDEPSSRRLMEEQLRGRLLFREGRLFKGFSAKLQ